MRAQDVLGSPPFLLVGMGLARIVPSRFGYWLSRRVARAMAKRRNHMFSTLRENLSHVVDGEMAGDQLDTLAEAAIYHAGRTYFDLFHRSTGDLKRGRVPVRLDFQWPLMERILRDERGTILVGPHMSNFDLAIQWIAAQGIEMQALSLAQPDTGDRVMNLLRKYRGIGVTPIDVGALRLAVDRLRHGGVVLTGVDRPVSGSDEPIPFFGALARLPTGHIRLALQTNSRIVVACCTQESDGYYAIRMAGPLEMEKTGDRRQDIRHNARRVLSIIEDMIRSAPQQWIMLVPVWRPEDAG